MLIKHSINPFCIIANREFQSIFKIVPSKYESQKFIKENYLNYYMRIIFSKYEFARTSL